MMALLFHRTGAIDVLDVACVFSMKCRVAKLSETGYTDFRWLLQSKWPIDSKTRLIVMNDGDSLETSGCNFAGAFVCLQKQC